MDGRAELREIAAGIYGNIDKQAEDYIKNNNLPMTTPLKATIGNYEIKFLSDGAQKINDINSSLELTINFKEGFLKKGYIEDRNNMVGFTKHEKNSALLGDDEAIPKFENKMTEILKAVQGKIKFEQIPPTIKNPITGEICK